MLNFSFLFSNCFRQPSHFVVHIAIMGSLQLEKGEAQSFKQRFCLFKRSVFQPTHKYYPLQPTASIPTNNKQVNLNKQLHYTLFLKRIISTATLLAKNSFWCLPQTKETLFKTFGEVQFQVSHFELCTFRNKFNSESRKQCKSVEIQFSFPVSA